MEAEKTQARRALAQVDAEQRETRQVLEREKAELAAGQAERARATAEAGARQKLLAEAEAAARRPTEACGRGGDSHQGGEGAA